MFKQLVFDRAVQTVETIDAAIKAPELLREDIL